MTGRRRWTAALAVLVATLAVGLAAQPATAAPAPRIPIAVGTLPAVSGFPIVVDGVTALTDATGVAHFSAVFDARPLSERLTLTDALVTVDGRPVMASGTSVSDVRARPLVRLELSYQVHFGFTAADGSSIDPSAITALTLKSTNGELVEVKPGETPWLHGTRVVQILGDSQVRHIAWTLQRVQYAGSNVVNAAQQVFVPAEQQDIDVRVLLFDVDFQVTDAFFGFPQSGALQLVFPDGTYRRYPVDARGQVSVAELPRGAYTLTSIGPGPNLSRTLAISGPQPVELTFFSWLDIGLALGVVLVLAGGLAWWGRTRRRKAKAADDDEATALALPAGSVEPAALTAGNATPELEAGAGGPEPMAVEPARATSGSP